MPYIRQEQRPPLDDHIFDLAEKIETPGQLNYVFSKIAHIVAHNGIVAYDTLNSIVGAFDLAKAEFVRRVVSPYEDQKIAENGDLFDRYLDYEASADGS